MARVCGHLSARFAGMVREVPLITAERLVPLRISEMESPT
ncbi:hypothetical protein HMPREF9371_1066 [Neisseria shayeganii 871]|uniref:Uncharacterized protein n=1 Tax=Neisseria shayeganii 871 TaxID=1032488 RepID=G4CHH7_9NEIS|nr:hypothetical protein HMPREF9371_1066 [Neisseria shayeganii 871]